MSYPTRLMVTLVEIHGSSCGSFSQRVCYVPDSSPPTYQKDGTGDFYTTSLFQVPVGNDISWKLTLRNLNPGSCQGIFTFLRSVAADDPEGTYYIINNGQPDSSLGTATAVNDD